ncbi:MAG: hypothetical protein ACK58T_49565, partial [Phycisphaerae bacterium]
PKSPARKRDEDDDEDEAPKKKSARTDIPPDADAPAKPAKGKKKPKAQAASEGAPQAETKPAKGAKAKKADARPEKAPDAVKAAKPEHEDDEVEELDDAALEDLIADIFAGEGGDSNTPPPEPLPAHKAYDLFKMVSAVASVGFDSTLAVDDRGGGDVPLGLRRSERRLRAALVHAAAAA